MDKNEEKTIPFRLKLMLKLWPYTLLPVVTFLGGCVWLWSGGIAFAVGLSAFVAVLVFLFCAFVGMATA